MFTKLLFLFLILFPTTLFADGVLVYIPPECRQRNKGGSCVFASITNCLRATHQWEKADVFWSKYRGPGNQSNSKSRMDREGIQYKMLTGCDLDGLKEALDSGRMVAIAWGSRHFANLVGIIDGKYYIVDNNRPTKYIIQDEKTFISYHKRSGGWGIVIMDGKVSRPIIQDNLSGYETKYPSK